MPSLTFLPISLLSSFITSFFHFILHISFLHFTSFTFILLSLLHSYLPSPISLSLSLGFVQFSSVIFLIIHYIFFRPSLPSHFSSSFACLPLLLFLPLPPSLFLFLPLLVPSSSQLHEYGYSELNLLKHLTVSTRL